jgi:Phosphotransferase enzyme family
VGGNIRRIVAGALGCPAASIQITRRPPIAHQSNRLFDVFAAGRHLIAKEFLHANRPDSPAREFRALQRVSSLDVAPRPVSVEGSVVVYDFLDGEMWDRRVPSAADLSGLAQVWIQLQELPTDGLWLARGTQRGRAEIQANLRRGFGTYAAWTSTQPDVRKQALAARCVAALERGLAAIEPLASMPAPLRFCRSDPRFANVIARPDGRLRLVDWEDSGLRDPAREVADLLLHPNQEDLLELDTWSAFLEPYLAVASRDDATLLERVDTYVLAFHFLARPAARRRRRTRAARHACRLAHQRHASQRSVTAVSSARRELAWHRPSAPSRRPRRDRLLRRRLKAFR